ncbi:hypothetical protein [Gracilimonas sediminicola]|uniref:Alpha/beta hydrolase n=1 Tax=Gracilimonas sediminicola TaxID=2952158 RepID=A0A9X2RGA6_9BACT|nr:hypothetical protein [Gracilimonas sediminicola]MCP9292257.1 hypothetical protein [Gracilimonas sediminicola]
MKYLNTILILVLSLLALENVYAQKKIGVFIHGFQGSSEKWTDVSEVPENWEGEIIDGFAAVDYETPELKDEYSLLN